MLPYNSKIGDPDMWKIATKSVKNGEITSYPPKPYAGLWNSITYDSQAKRIR